MGSFNGTCGISNLPILADDRVCFIILRPEAPADWQHNSGCEPTRWWAPYALPIRGTYDGLGRVEGPDEAPHVEGLRACLKRNVHPMELGENPHHDLPVNDEMFEGDDWLEQIQQRIGNGRLTVKLSQQPEAKLGSILVREDVWEALAAWIFYGRHGVEIGVEYAADKLRARRGPPEWSEEDLARFAEYDDPEEKAMWMQGRLEMRRIVEWSRGETRVWGYTSPLREVFEARVMDSEEVDEAALLEFAKLSQVGHRMASLSRIWHPTAGTGQDRSVCETHAKFADMVSRIARGSAVYPEDDDEEEWLGARRAELKKLLPPLPTWKVWEHFERLTTKELKDETGAVIPTEGFGEKTQFGHFICLHVYTNDEGDYLYCVYNDHSEEWKVIEHNVAPHPDLLGNCKRVYP